MFRKPQILRRYAEAKSTGGYSFSGSASDKVILADIQTTDADTATESDGDSSLQWIKVFSDDEIRMADEKNGAKADLIWYQGKWYECRSTNYKGNTILRHWISKFVECPNQMEPPKEELLREVQA
ncbi:MAG: hypothetical protein OSJ60_08740 [Lachnospiraceae bacterium]|nr:hypothetical protein [Lachnospiraceae bacterium]